MAQNIGMNIVLTGDNSQLKRVIGETKAMLRDPIAPSNSGSPIAPAAAGQSAASVKGNEKSEFLINGNSLEIQRGILQELQSLSSFFIRGNGNQALRQGTQQQTQQTQGKTEADKMRESLKTVMGAAALAAANGVIAYDTGSARIRMAEYQGDYFGSEIAKNNRTAGAINASTSFIPAITGIMGAIFAGPMGVMIGASAGKAVQGAIDSVVGTATENKNVHLEEQQLLSESYKARLKLTDESLAMYGGENIIKNSARANAGISNSITSSFLGKSKNTGMDLDEFQSLANEFSRYGISDHFKAGDLARATALTQAFTGADASNFLGIQSRLGKSSGGAIDSMNTAYSAAISSGLGKGQFSEFLAGLERAVEDGISEGFIRSSDDISKTMVMFSKLSGNDPTLQGEYGFKMLRQMEGGLKNATNLSSTSHLLAFQALRGLNTGKQGAEFIEGQDALNTLAFMESGLDTNKFTAISKRFSAQYGDDTMEKILAIKDLYGVNYNGAMKISRLQDRAAAGDYVSNDEIKKVMANPEFNTDQKNMVNHLNAIKENTSILGEGAFRKYLEGLAGIDDKYREERGFNEKYGLESGVKLSEKEKGILEGLRTQGANGTASGYYEMQLATIVAGLNDEKLSQMVHDRLNGNAFDVGDAETKAIETAAIVEAIKQGFKESEIKFNY